MLGVAAVPCLQGKKKGISPIQPFSAKTVSETSANSVVCKRVPCATEQGINSRKQGSNSALSGRNREFGAKIDTLAAMKHVTRLKRAPGRQAESSASARGGGKERGTLAGANAAAMRSPASGCLSATAGRAS